MTGADAWVSEPTPRRLAVDELVLATDYRGSSQEAIHVARAGVYAALGILDELAGIRTGLGAIADTIEGP